MTNWITNTIYMVMTNSEVVPVTLMTAETQTDCFFSGLSYGIPAALALAVVWGVAKAVRGGGWMWNRGE